jgi:hypothetical protein
VYRATTLAVRGRKRDGSQMVLFANELTEVKVATGGVAIIDTGER